MTCTRCGGQIPAGTHLCTACGAAVLPPGPAHSGRHIAIAVAALVVAAAITGTAVAFAHSGAARRAAGTVAGPHRTPGTVATMPQAGDVPGSGAATPVSPATSPATGPPASPSSSPAPPLVAVEPAAAAGPHEVAVLGFLTRYFTAINHHRYRAYLRLYSRDSRGSLSEAQFEAGYGTTRDVRPTLVGLTAPRRGQLAATVTFTSHQRADTSPQHAACVRWTITLYLVRDGRRYVMGDPPADYAASGRPC